MKLFNSIGFKTSLDKDFIEYEEITEKTDENIEKLRLINQEIQKSYSFLSACIENNEYLVVCICLVNYLIFIMILSTLYVWSLRIYFQKFVKTCNV